MIPRLSPGRRAALWTFLGCIMAVLAKPVPLPAQVSAEESARRLKPAAGLEATLWASEPMVVNPTNIDIDSRGRVWATEGLNYRLSRGGNARFRRVDDSDKIKILEDTDGDGKADKLTVFADRIFPVPMGIAVEEHWSKEGKYTGCRVFIGNSPNLLVIEDTDGDDKADKRYPLLTGFSGVDSDHGVHGMVLGLDGKLYFTQGDGGYSLQKDGSERKENFDVIDKSGRHVTSDQLANTLRVNRDGTRLEVVCDRQRNNYEVCLNSFGNIFISDNDDDGNRGCRVIWALDDGRVVTGLPVEDTPERVVVKTAEGQRVVVRTGEIEQRETSDVSLMPEGLAQTLAPEELIDLLAFLSSLRQPVSIVGQYHVIGPMTEPGGKRTFDGSSKIDLAANVRGPRAEPLTWRRLAANAEGLADLTAMAGGSPQTVIYAATKVTSPIDQPAKLVVETHSGVTVWLRGNQVISSGPTRATSEPREVEVTLPRGTSTLLLRLTGGLQKTGQGTLVTTFVSARAVSFTGQGASLSSK
ncbi:MAG: PVC-type heme-binding CxxCH protein [Isosphaeraceae bacterium]